MSPAEFINGGGIDGKITASGSYSVLPHQLSVKEIDTVNEFVKLSDHNKQMISQIIHHLNNYKEAQLINYEFGSRVDFNEQ